jgi:hypothetical protein
MRTWAHWTAEAVMLTATVAAAGAGFADSAFAVSGGGGARFVLRPRHRGPDGGAVALTMAGRRVRGTRPWGRRARI